MGLPYLNPKNKKQYNMGQYYKPVVKKGKMRLTINPWDFDCGAKLLEHSYIGNHIVESVMHFIDQNPKCRVVWAGDYADEEKNGKSLFEMSYDFNLIRPYDMVVGKNIIINIDKKEFVDLRKCRKDKFGYTIHPLPVLTAEGCGRGGGDYDMEKGNGAEFVGTWSRDRLVLDDNAPEGFDEIIPDFVDGEPADTQN